MADNSDYVEESNDSDYENSCGEMADNSDHGEDPNDSDYENTNQRFYKWYVIFLTIVSQTSIYLAFLTNQLFKIKQTKKTSKGVMI